MLVNKLQDKIIQLILQIEKYFTCIFDSVLPLETIDHFVQQNGAACKAGRQLGLINDNVSTHPHTIIQPHATNVISWVVATSQLDVFLNVGTHFSSTVL